MSERATWSLRGRNPDILTCIASLSNDEVFTPPEFANRMLDTLAEAWAESNNGANIWADSSVTFLDPCTKSGVFLREITRRLTEGLASEIPDLQERVDHILTKQVFGIAITRLTALMARRSLYCSKHASGTHSIARSFTSDNGNIWYERTEHAWVENKCTYCGSPRSVLDRDAAVENYAYAFIHADDVSTTMSDLFGNTMQFDVIVGNPPYQVEDGGHGRSASPIYQRFVEQAIQMQPKFLTMVIPARWYGGGKGLSEFRQKVLSDEQFRSIYDYEDAGDVFPGIDLAGGVCYFLWQRGSEGLCNVVSCGPEHINSMNRKLNEFPVLVRNSGAIPIIHKVLSSKEERMSQYVSSSKPFGLRTFVRPEVSGDLTLRWEKGEGPYPREKVSVGIELIDKWKVITSYVGYDHAGNPGKDGRRRVLSKVDILPPGTICTETYLVIGAYDSRYEAENLVAYMKTRFFRFLLAQLMYSHHLTRSAYDFVPVLDMNQRWTDTMLADKYHLSNEEIEFMKSKIKPFVAGASNDEE